MPPPPGLPPPPPYVSAGATTSHDQKTYTNTLGILGNIVSMLLFLSPLYVGYYIMAHIIHTFTFIFKALRPTFIKILRTKEVGKFTPLPYVLTVLNCGFWIIYGTPEVKNLTLVVSINAAGLVIEFIYVTIYMIYARGSTKKNCGILIILCGIFFGIITGITLGVVKQSLRWKVVGACCVSIGIIQNFAPLTVIGTVIKTKSAEYLPVLLSFFILINGAIWTAYGAWPFDIFIIIPNAFAVGFGIAQLALWCIYRKNPKVNQDMMFAKSITPDERYALEEPPDRDSAEHFPRACPIPEPRIQISPRLGRSPSGRAFPQSFIFRLEELLEDMKAREFERSESEKARRAREDERVLQETKRELAEQNRQRQEKEREEMEKWRRSMCDEGMRCLDDALRR